MRTQVFAQVFLGPRMRGEPTGREAPDDSASCQAQREAATTQHAAHKEEVGRQGGGLKNSRSCSRDGAGGGCCFEPSCGRACGSSFGGSSGCIIHASGRSFLAICRGACRSIIRCVCREIDWRFDRGACRGASSGRTCCCGICAAQCSTCCCCHHRPTGGCWCHRSDASQQSEQPPRLGSRRLVHAAGARLPAVC
jgi:hypothetical protein